DRGLINATLVERGWLARPLPLMYNRFGVAVALVHVFLPFMVLSLTGVLKRIDPHTLEAAMTLGASPRRAFLEVTLPLSLPGLLAALVRQLLRAARVHAGAAAVHRAGAVDGRAVHAGRHAGRHRARARAIPRPRCGERLRDLAPAAAPDPHRRRDAAVLHAGPPAPVVLGAPDRPRRGDHPVRRPHGHGHPDPLRSGPGG